MNISKQYLSSGHAKRPGGNYTKTSITIHSTGNLHSTAQNERDWLDNPKNTRIASWHYVVDEKEVIQAIPDNESAYHCGMSKGNKYSISIEICESGDRRKTLLNVAQFVAMKLQELGLTIYDIKRHYDWTSKVCPRILIDISHIKGGMDWKWFLQEVENNMIQVEKIKMIVNGQEKEVERILVNGTNYIKIRDIADSLNCNISNNGSIPILTSK